MKNKIRYRRFRFDRRAFGVIKPDGTGKNVRFLQCGEIIDAVYVSEYGVRCNATNATVNDDETITFEEGPLAWICFGEDPREVTVPFRRIKEWWYSRTHCFLDEDEGEKWLHLCGYLFNKKKR